jgi:hypothetical protein
MMRRKALPHGSSTSAVRSSVGTTAAGAATSATSGACTMAGDETESGVPLARCGTSGWIGSSASSRWSFTLRLLQALRGVRRPS